MSPEQIEAEGLDDPRSDVFSLGVVLYELLAREHPFRRPTVPATLTAIVNETPPDPSSRQPQIQPGIDRIGRRCLEKRREERYPSAQDRGRARSRPRRRQLGGGAARCRGEEPVSGPLVLHRGGFGTLLRPRGGGHRPLEEAPRPQAPRRHRSLRRGQDVVREAGVIARGRRAGAVHAQSAGGAGAVRRAPREALARGGRPRPLSLRDDFLMRCHAFRPSLPFRSAHAARPDDARGGLRQALVEPAAKRGYRFEDDALVDEMISAVEGGRGALPLLAFAVSRLWEKSEAGGKAPHARGIPADRRRRGGARAARGGDDGPDRRRRWSRPCATSSAT